MSCFHFFLCEVNENCDEGELTTNVFMSIFKQFSARLFNISALNINVVLLMGVGACFRPSTGFKTIATGEAKGSNHEIELYKRPFRTHYTEI